MKPNTHVVVDTHRGAGVIARAKSAAGARKLADYLKRDYNASITRFIARPALPEDGPDTGMNTLRDEVLSFRTITYDNRGRNLRENEFDVPLKTYGAGHADGYRAAAEMLAALRGEPDYSFLLRGALSEALKVIDEPGTPKSRRGAAVSFVSTMMEMISFAAKRADFQGYIAMRERASQEAEARRDAEDADLRAEFKRRMAEGRARKQALRDEDANRPKAPVGRAAKAVEAHS